MVSLSSSSVCVCVSFFSEFVLSVSSPTMTSFRDVGLIQINPTSRVISFRYARISYQLPPPLTLTKTNFLKNINTVIIPIFNNIFYQIINFNSKFIIFTCLTKITYSRS